MLFPLNLCNNLRVILIRIIMICNDCEKALSYKKNWIIKIIFLNLQPQTKWYKNLGKIEVGLC